MLGWSVALQVSEKLDGVIKTVTSLLQQAGTLGQKVRHLPVPPEKLKIFWEHVGELEDQQKKLKVTPRSGPQQMMSEKELQLTLHKGAQAICQKNMGTCLELKITILVLKFFSREMV